MNAEPTAPAKTRAAIYIVDNDMAVRDSLCSLLAGLADPIKTYEKAEDFLNESLLSERHCLITELHLPGMSGLELILELRAKAIQIPTIVLASNSDVSIAVRTMRAGAIDFIDKPVVDRLLLKRVRQVLAELS